MCDCGLTINSGKYERDLKAGSRSNSLDSWRFIVIAAVLWFTGVNVASMNSKRIAAHASAAGLGAGAAPDPRFAARALELCRMLEIGQGSVRLASSSSHCRLRRGVEIDTISVDCTDGQGRHLASMLFETQSGRLLSLGCLRESRPAQVRSLIGRETAGRLAWQWMQDTRIAFPGERWRLCKSRVTSRTQWQVWFASGDRRAMVQIDGSSGMLSVAMAYRTSPC